MNQWKLLYIYKSFHWLKNRKKKEKNDKAKKKKKIQLKTNCWRSLKDTVIIIIKHLQIIWISALSSRKGFDMVLNK